jgi:hypothetical protein
VVDAVADQSVERRFSALIFGGVGLDYLLRVLFPCCWLKSS